MNDAAATYDVRALNEGASRLAIVRCPSGRIDTSALTAAAASIDAGVDLVVLAPQETPEDAIRALTGCLPPCATAQPVTDALKHTAEGRLVATVDRSRIVRPGLPMLLKLSELGSRLASLPDEKVLPWELVDDPSVLTLVDGHGIPIGGPE